MKRIQYKKKDDIEELKKLTEAIIQGEEIPDPDENELDNPYPFCTFAWGSCQYESAYEFYHEIKGTKETILNNLMRRGIKVTFRELLPFEQIKSMFLKEILETLDDPEDMQLFRNAIKKYKSIADLLGFLKDNAWDLWSAAPFMAGIAFVQLDITGVEKAGAPKGIPILNAMVQSENNNVAIYCALLNAFYNVPEEAFKDFDT